MNADDFYAGDRVRYSNGFDEQELGTVTSTNAHTVFVRYDSHPHAERGTATAPEDLTLVHRPADPVAGNLGEPCTACDHYGWTHGDQSPTPATGAPCHADGCTTCPDGYQPPRPLLSPEADAAADRAFDQAAAVNAFYIALQDGAVRYIDHETDTVDATGHDIVAALLAAGWRPPTTEES